MIPVERLSSFVLEKLKHLLVWVGEGGGGGMARGAPRPQCLLVPRRVLWVEGRVRGA